MSATRSLPITSRQKLIRRIQRELEKRGYPRLQMLLLVGLTGGAGFLASFLLLIYGVESLGLRYSLCVAIAYLVLYVPGARTLGDALAGIGGVGPRFA